MTHPYVGKLTAFRGSSIAMTVSRVEDDTENEGYLLISTQYFDGAKLRETHNVSEELFVGFGDNLTFTGGAFVAAFDDYEEEDEDDDLDDEDEDEDLDDDRKPGESPPLA